MVRIITDTTSGLPDAIARRYDIPVIPQVITFGNESFLEGLEMDNAEFMRRLTSSRELPKTAAPPPQLFTREFERLVPLGEPILCIHPSSILSGTVRSATVAARDFGQADIRIIDTQLVSSPLATLVELAAQWAEEGVDADTIVARLQDMLPRAHVYFSVATLEYLARGGRIGGATALLGSVLQVKPILTLRQGRIEQFARERTEKRALARLRELANEQMPHDRPGYLSVMHSAVPDKAQSLAAELASDLHLPLESIPLLDVPPAIVTHGGPGIVGIAFFE